MSENEPPVLVQIYLLLYGHESAGVTDTSISYEHEAVIQVRLYLYHLLMEDGMFRTWYCHLHRGRKQMHRAGQESSSLDRTIRASSGPSTQGKTQVLSSETSCSISSWRHQWSENRTDANKANTYRNSGHNFFLQGDREGKR